MSLIQVGLVDQTKKINSALMSAAAAALNVQVVRDLPQHWPITASVTYLPDPNNIPPGVWPIFLVASLPPREGGFHQDKHNQPYSKVIATPSSDEWTIDASHELIEMLVDPYGNRMQTSRSIVISGDSVIDGDGQFNYLVEAADPCEADAFAYQIQGIAVSDFITPHYYDAVKTDGTKYSFTGAITAPRQLLKGGYISYVDLATNEWQQILWVDPNSPPVYKNLGPAGNVKSFRIWIDGKMAEMSRDPKARATGNKALLAASKKAREKLTELGKVRAGLFT